MDKVPVLRNVEIFPWECGMEYALHLYFDDYERKYIFQVPKHVKNVNEITVDGYLFDRKIFEDYKCEMDGDAITRVRWSNGYVLTADYFLKNSTRFFVPRYFDTVHFKDDKMTITKIMEWDGVGLWEHTDGLENDPLISMLFRGSCNCNCFGTILNKKYERITNLDFGYIGDLIDDRRLVYVFDRGFGYIDINCNFVIPPIYDRASEFQTGIARVQLDENDETTALLIDKNGDKVDLGCDIDIWSFTISEENDGMKRFSSLKCCYDNVGYDMDHDDWMGFNGYLDEKNKIVIIPQYIYADDFFDGKAIVCRGEYRRDGNIITWTQKGKWGIIDKNGNTVVPFEYDSIDKYTYDDENWYIAFSGYYKVFKNGIGGILDRNGNWITGSEFIPSEYSTDFFNNRYVECSSKDDNELCGIYDVLRGIIAIEPKEYNYIENYNDYIVAGKECWDNKSYVMLYSDVFDILCHKLFRFMGDVLYNSEMKTFELKKYEADGEKYAEIKVSELDQMKLGDDMRINEDLLEWSPEKICNGEYRVFKDKEYSGLKSDKGDIVIPAIYDEVRQPDENGLVKVFIGKEKIVNSYTIGCLTTNNKIVLDPTNYYGAHYGSANRLIAERKDKSICEVFRVEKK